jgi:signal transduction histidine kinase
LSLRNRLILFAAACLLPLLVVIAAILAETADAGRDQVLDAQAATSEVVASVLTATLADNHKVLQELASINNLRGMDRAKATDAIEQFSRAHPNLYGLFLLDTNRNLVASTGLNPGQYQLHSSFMAAVDRSLDLGEPGVSTVLTAPENPDARVIALTMPVRARDQAEGDPIGIVGALLSAERLQAAVTPLARGDTLIAVVADGQVIAAQGADPAVAALALSTVPPLSMSTPGTLSYFDENGMERFAVYTPVQGSTWGVLVTHPSPGAYGANRAIISRSIAAVAAAALVTLVLGALAAELLARPLREAAAQAAALAAGDYTPREPIQWGSSDIAAIGAALGSVASRLREQVFALDEARDAGASQAGQMRDLNRRTVRLQEDERRRIASEIHDAVSPLITGAMYQARALRLGQPDEPGRSVARRDSALDSISDLLSQAMEELHGVIFALRPPDLDDIGVVAAIERYIAQMQRSGLNVILEAEEDPPALTPEVRLAIYRIVQEALHNALRHASADEAVVSFETVDDVLRVTIRDNGAGFNPQMAARPTALGLLSMRERAVAIGATFAVMSRPGDGTTVTIERRLEPELAAVPEMAAVEELPELSNGTAKRISA